MGIKVSDETQTACIVLDFELKKSVKTVGFSSLKFKYILASIRQY